MKRFAVLMMMLVLLSSFALAERPIAPDYVTLVSGSAESGGSGTRFFFLPNQQKSDTSMRKIYYFDGKNSFPDYVGQECKVGEYIVPLRFHTRWTDGERVFDADYLKSSSSDLLPIKNWKTASWFLQGESYHPYDAYGCKYAGAQLAQPEQANGRFTSALSFPSKVKAGSYVTIKGKYTVTKSGPFVLEAFINPKTQQPLQVVSSSTSSCDGSYFWAGSNIQGVAGYTYDFSFTVRAPSEPGKYTLEVHAWTKCWKDGGKEINKIVSQIEVAGQECSPLNVVSNLGRYFKNIGQYVWSLGNSGAQSVIEAGKCTVGQIDNYCGSRDSDGDTIPDACDYCPHDKGVPQQNNGCHPCFGMDPYSDAGKECYKTYKDSFPPPARLVPIVNPPVSTQSVCSGNTVVTSTVSAWGDVAEKDRTDCGSKVCTEKGDTAVCESPEAPVTVVGEGKYACEGNTVMFLQTMSDGTTKKSAVQHCPDGCAGGECVTQTVGGVPTTLTGDETPSGAVPENYECVVDSDCAPTEYCQSYLCVDASQDYCSENADCADGEECLGGLCAQAFEPECAADADCSSDQECFDGYCLLKTEIVDTNTSSACTEDTLITCDTGGQVTAEICVNGQLVPSGVTCVSEEGTGASDGSSGSSSFIGSIPGIEKVSFLTGSTGEVDKNKLFTYLAVFILVIGAGYLGYVKRFKKSGKRRRKK